MSEIVKGINPNFEISALLGCMMMGAVFTNLTSEEILDKVMFLVERVSPPILLCSLS